MVVIIIVYNNYSKKKHKDNKLEVVIMKNYRITYKWIMPNALYIEDMVEIRSKDGTFNEIMDYMNIIKNDTEHYELISVEKID